MATIKSRIETWRHSELRWASQVNNTVLTAWYNKWLQIFQKYLLEYVANTLHTTSIDVNTTANQDLYDFPFGLSNLKDFYSITQIRVAYRTDKYGNPVYRVAQPINLTDYNIKPNWYQKWKPAIWGRISKLNPRYSFVGSDQFKIYPTPDVSITKGISLTFNYFLPALTEDQIFGVNAVDENVLDLPRYFLDAIDDYLTFRLYQAENPELAQTYYEQFRNTLFDNIYWLNRDKRPIEEWFADTRYFSHY